MGSKINLLRFLSISLAIVSTVIFFFVPRLALSLAFVEDVMSAFSLGDVSSACCVVLDTVPVAIMYCDVMHRNLVAFVSM